MMSSNNFENMVTYSHTEDEVVVSDCDTRWETIVVGS